MVEEREDRGSICGCDNCKWHSVYDCDPEDDSSRTYICLGIIHHNLLNPDISIGFCHEWSPDMDTYGMMTGYQGPVPYRYRYQYDRDRRVRPTVSG